jgi:hypothetical protein
MFEMLSRDVPQSNGWKTTLLTCVFFVRTSVFLALSPHGTKLTVLIRMSVYGRLQMLDGLVSSHPKQSRLLRAFVNYGCKSYRSRACFSGATLSKKKCVITLTVGI